MFRFHTSTLLVITLKIVRIKPRLRTETEVKCRLNPSEMQTADYTLHNYILCY